MAHRARARAAGIVLLQGSTAAGTPAPDGSTPIATGTVGGLGQSLQVDLLERSFGDVFDWHAVVAAIGAQEGWDAAGHGTLSGNWQIGTTVELRPFPYTPRVNRLSLMLSPFVGGSIGPGNAFVAGGTVSVNFNILGFDPPTRPARSDGH